MLKLLESLELLNTITGNDPKEINEIASKAFSNCPLCLEAAAIVSKTISKEKEKEAFLLTAVNNAENEIKRQNIKDVDVLNSLLRGYFELGCLYFEYGKYSQAIKYYELVKRFDKSNDFQVSYRLISLYAFFEDEKTNSLYEELITIDDNYSKVKCEVPYLVYLYKNNNYDKCNELIQEINKHNNQLINILGGTIKEESIEAKQALTVLKNNSFLINSCPMFINYIKEVAND